MLKEESSLLCQQVQIHLRTKWQKVLHLHWLMVHLEFLRFMVGGSGISGLLFKRDDMLLSSF